MFLFWGFPPKSPQLTFFWGVLRVDFQSFLSKASRCSFLDPPFWLLHLFVIFSNWVDSSLLSWKILSHLLSWFIFLRSPRYQTSFMKCRFLSHQSFFWTIGGWWDMPIFVPCVHKHAPSNCPNLSWSLSTFPKDPRFLGVPRYPGLLLF